MNPPICRKCGREIEPGEYLKWRHVHPKGHGHTASPAPARPESPLTSRQRVPA